MLRVLFLLVTNLLTCTVASQVASQDAVFFKQQLPAYKTWLMDKNFDEILTPTAIYADSVLVITHSLSNIDGFENLILLYSEKFEESLPDLLLDRLSFIMDVRKELLVIEAESNEGFVSIYSVNGEVVVEREKKMGQSVDEDFTLLVDDMEQLTLRGHCEIGDRSIETVKQLLIDSIRNCYKSYETGFFENYEFKVIDNYEKDLILEISNITKVVLTDNFFEHLRFNIEVQAGKNESELHVDISVQGKYAAGILWAPRDNRYKDMELKYEQKVEDFTKGLRAKLISFLK